MSEQFESVELFTTEQKASYGIGRQLGDQLNTKPFSGFDLESALAGFVDGMHGNDLKVSGEDINAAFKVVQDQIQKEKEDEAGKLGAEGKKFLDENAQREEVTVTDSGLQYEVLNTGEGAVPSKSNTVRTHYHGTLINGEVFDSSYDRGEPAEFPVGGVIAGWTEALQMMTVGSKWRLYVPYNLAYGERGAGGKIGPYATLIFDVELLDIVA